MSQQVLVSKLASEVKLITADFTSQLPIGVTISSKVATATVYSGVDASPSSLISGSATSSGAIVSQKVTGGVLGVLYELLFTITTSDAQTLLMTAFLAVVPDLT